MIYLLLFLEFFKVGLFCFGGAFGMLPLIEETVLNHGWLTEGEFYSFVGVCESTPGPIAVNIATYIGSVQGGVLGSVCATLGVVLPSFIIILLIASVLKRLGNNRYFKGFISGVAPVVTALIISTGFILLAKSIGYSGGFDFSLELRSVVIFTLLCGIYFGFKGMLKKTLSAVQIILISAVLGLSVCMLL